jgi:UDP-glucose 4-epimerase
MRLLVTGSSGTIGTRLCERLLEEGHDVVGADLVPNQWNPSANKRTLIADLRDEKAFDTLPHDVEMVVHLAANARVYELVKDPSRALDNFVMLFRTLEFCRLHKIPRFVFASSRECYGNIKMERCTEDLVRVENCESPYTASKLGGEALVTSYEKCYGLAPVILRFSNVYGAYDVSDRVVPLFIRQARKNEPLVIFGKGKLLDFTYIDDTVAGIIQVLERFDAVKNETFNLAFGSGSSIVSCADIVKELTKSTSSVSFAPSRIGEVTHYVADVSKARKLLGFDPKIPFREGMEKTVAWYLKHT